MSIEDFTKMHPKEALCKQYKEPEFYPEEAYDSQAFLNDGENQNADPT